MSVEVVSVLHRTGQWCSGIRTTGGILAYDVPILPQWQVPGRPATDRYFVLSDEGIQLSRTNTFTGSLEGGWYIDLIEVEEVETKKLVIHDLYVDIIVLPTSIRYEVLDLNELAEALQEDAIDVATTVKILRNTQQFVDKHLRNLDQDRISTWPDFPPTALKDLIDLPPFNTPQA